MPVNDGIISLEGIVIAEHLVAPPTLFCVTLGATCVHVTRECSVARVTLSRQSFLFACGCQPLIFCVFVQSLL